MASSYKLTPDPRRRGDVLHPVCKQGASKSMDRVKPSCCSTP